jgi:hypothetical protein
MDKSIDPYAAYLEAIEGVIARERGETGTWSHPAIYWASVAIGAFDLKSKTYPQLKRRWSIALANELASPHQEPVPPPRHLRDRYRARSSPAASRKMVDQLRVSIANSRHEKRDPKRWARRIQARIEEGDDTVPDFLAQAARRILNQ